MECPRNKKNCEYIGTPDCILRQREFTDNSCFSEHRSHQTAEVFESASTPLLCDVRFKIGVEINWPNPAKNMEESAWREEKERIIKYEASKLAERMTNKLLNEIT